MALLTAGELAVAAQVAPRSASALPSNAEMRSVGDAPVGIPVHEFIDKSVWVLAHEMLLQPHLDTEAQSNQPVHRGVEMDLFAPGDFGIVVRYCW